MNALIKIEQNSNGSSVCSARELYNFLEVKTPFRKWIDRMLTYGFTENQDFIRSDNFVLDKQEAKEYALTLECAKEISMLQRNEKGKQARQYFIECEKNLKANHLQQMPSVNTLDFMQMALDKMRENENRLTKLENKIETALISSGQQSEFFTIVGFATLNKIKCPLQLACKLGKLSKAEAKKNSLELHTIPDPRFGLVNLYPKQLLENIFKQQNLI